MDNIADKENKLINILQGLKSCALAFSGGTDSTLLLYYLSQLNIKAKAYTFHSYLYPTSELEEAKNIASSLNMPHEIISADPLEDIENIKHNPKERCYICKKHMFSILKEKAKKEGYEVIIEGSNFDDRKDFRPGKQAVIELNALSPLDMAGLTKENVRSLLKKAGLKNHNKPSFACYFSRFPYNMEISQDMIEKISLGEIYIHSLGLESIRLRYHDKIIRIEAKDEDMKVIVNDNDIRAKIITYLKSLGFLFICIDLEGYVTGSMNRLIDI